jgi:predicted DNA-binding transcriptional regulator AlpA
MRIQYLRFRELRARGLVNNWVTLNRWVQEQGFPPGRLLGPNTRVWTEAEIEAWVASRPIKVSDSDAA